jgi:hypothetical protein
MRGEQRTILAQRTFIAFNTKELEETQLYQTIKAIAIPSFLNTRNGTMKKIKLRTVVPAYILLIAKHSLSFTPTARITTVKIWHAQSSPNSNNVPIQKNQTSSIPPSSQLSEMCDEEYDDHKTNKEIQWLLRTTSKMIGPSLSAPPIGELPAARIRKFPLIMRAWLKRCSIPHSDAAHVVERLLERLIDERDQGNENVEKEGVLCTNVFNLAIESWKETSGQEFRMENDEGVKITKKKMEEFHAARRATNILKKMEEASTICDGSINIRPNAISYWLTLKAWVKSREPNAVDEMENILRRMEDLPRSQQNQLSSSGVEPTNIQCYNMYLYALANRKSNSPKSDAKKAKTVLQELKARSTDAVGLAPDVNSYNQVIKILAKLRDFDSSMQAHAIFDEMLDDSNTTGVYPDTDTFNALMNCFLKSGPKKGRQYVERLLKTMVELGDDEHSCASPDRFSVNTAIAVIAKSGRQDSVRKSYFMLMNMDSKFGVSPDVTSFNLVLDAFAKSRDLQGGKKAKSLLNQMEELYAGGNADVRPDSFSYSTVIDAIAKRDDSGKLAEEILSRMKQLHQTYGGNKPDVVVCNSMMNAYSTRGDFESVSRTKEILHYMEESGDEDVRPNIISYNTLLKAFSYAREDFTQDAEDLLNRLESTKRNGESDIAPDVITYTSVITCFARSDVPCKATLALKILRQMIDAYKAGNSSARPTIFTFNACLNSCAFTFEQKEKVNAFCVAVSTLVLLQEYTKPDHTTYGTLLKSWCNLIPKDDERRPRAVKSVFLQCKKDGMVGPMVMQQLKYAASPDLYSTLVGRDITEDFEISSLPFQWSRNVKERHGKVPTITRHKGS